MTSFIYKFLDRPSLSSALLLALAGAADVEGKKAAMFAGAKINSTEKRAAFHPALRAPKGHVMEIDGVDQGGHF